MKIEIPKPCHENWDQMTPDEQGKFCQVCHKTVTDFSLLSDSDIVDFFSVNEKGICGRFSEQQINRPLFYNPIESIFSKLALGVAVTSATFLSAQQKQPKQKDSSCNVKKDSLPVRELMGKPVVRPLQGKVAVIYPLYIVNGKEVSLSEFRQLDKNKIKKSITLNSVEAQKKYGQKGINGAVIVTTK